MIPEKESSFPPTGGCYARLLRTLRRPLAQPRIEIVSYDSHGSEFFSGGAGVEIRDPKSPKKSYFIIFRQIGPDPRDRFSWEFYYASHCDFAEERKKGSDKYEPKPVKREEIEALLAKYNSSTERVLEEYCQKLGEVS